MHELHGWDAARRRGRRLLLAVLPCLLLPASAHAQEISTDVTVDLAGTLATDEQVVEDRPAGVAPVELGALPASADLVAYTIASDGDVLFVLDTAASLPGGVHVTPRDVVRYDGAGYAVELRGADHGVPAGAQVDALGVIEGDLLLSFDVTVALGPLTAADEDLVRLESTQPDVWSLVFDGSAQGIPAAADLDGADVLDATGALALSFDVSGSVGGIDFDDEDVLLVDLAGPTWSKRYDGAARHAALVAADVDALFVPAPGARACALATAAGLALLRARRGGAST